MFRRPHDSIVKFKCQCQIRWSIYEYNYRSSIKKNAKKCSRVLWIQLNIKYEDWQSIVLCEKFCTVRVRQSVLFLFVEPFCSFSTSSLRELTIINGIFILLIFFIVPGWILFASLPSLKRKLNGKIRSKLGQPYFCFQAFRGPHAYRFS